jgi:Fur family ferric uptake transcriptional regulator
MQLGYALAMGVIEQNLQEALRAEGVRITRQRAAILGIIASAHDHPDANELHRRVQLVDRTVSLSTVYRTMAALERRGVIHRHSFDGAPARFESADQNHHDHIINIDTGEVVEFRSQKIEELQAQIAAELGFEVVRHRLELYCRKVRKPRRSAKL